MTIYIMFKLGQRAEKTCRPLRGVKRLPNIVSTVKVTVQGIPHEANSAGLTQLIRKGFLIEEQEISSLADADS